MSSYGKDRTEADSPPVPPSLCMCRLVGPENSERTKGGLWGVRRGGHATYVYLSMNDRWDFNVGPVRISPVCHTASGAEERGSYY